LTPSHHFDIIFIRLTICIFRLLFILATRLSSASSATKNLPESIRWRFTVEFTPESKIINAIFAVWPSEHPTISSNTREYTQVSPNSTSSTSFVGKWQIHSDHISQYNYHNHYNIYNVTTIETRISKESKSNFFILLLTMLGQ